MSYTCVVSMVLTACTCVCRQMVEKSLLGISLAFNDMYKLAYGLLFASLHSKPDLDRYNVHVQPHLHDTCTCTCTSTVQCVATGNSVNVFSLSFSGCALLNTRRVFIENGRYVNSSHNKFCGLK